MNLFYAPGLHENSGTYVFEKDESRHIVKVLRKNIGDSLFLTNGKGGWFSATITDNDPKKTRVKIIDFEQKESEKPVIHVAVAPTKSNERMEWFLEKATEVGIHRITPIITEHSERRKINRARYEKIVISAMKQSLKAYKPVVEDLTKFKDFVSKDFGSAQKFIAYCQSDIPLKKALKPADEVVIITGPEGGFSPAEIALAESRGFVPVSLSPHRLRTETAALMAVATVHLCFPEK